MPGFPTRAGRPSFGPDPINSRPVRDPRKQLDGETVGRLMFWQLGGLGLISPIAWFRATPALGVITLNAHKEAFQPRGGVGPTLGWTSTGLYTFSYSALYPDEQGVEVPLSLQGCAALAVGATPAHGQLVELATGHSGSIAFCTLAGAAFDPDAIFVVLW